MLLNVTHHAILFAAASGRNRIACALLDLFSLSCWTQSSYCPCALSDVKLEALLLTTTRFIASQTAGGVYLPDSQAHKTNEGEVIAVGPGRVTESGTKVPVNVSVGDKVLLPEYGGQTLKLGSEEFSLFRDEDILGKFEVRY